MQNKYENLIDLFIKNDNIARNNANFVRGIPTLEHIVTAEVMRDYLFDRILKGIPIRIQHEEGWAYVHQSFRLSAYSYTGKNVLIFKINNEVKMMSFEDAYEYFDVKETLIDAEKEVYQKDLSNLNVNVLDRNGWTKVTKITKKKRTKDIVVLKTRHSEMMEITEDHPIIIGEDYNKDVIHACDAVPYKHKQFKTSLLDKLKDEDIFKVKEIDMTNYLNKNEYTVYPDYIMKKGYENGFIKRKIKLTPELGYIIGFILAEGWIGKKRTFIYIVNKDKELLRHFTSILFNELGIPSYLVKKENDIYYLEIRNKCFSEFVNIFAKVNYHADGKYLNSNIFKFSKEFIAGIIAGVIDGDGTVNDNGQISIRITSGKLVYQLAYLLRLLGYYPAISYSNNKFKEKEYNELAKAIKQRRDLYVLQFTVRKFVSSYDIPSYKFEKAKKIAEKLDRNTVFYKENEWVNIHSINKITNPLTLKEVKYVYDITTESHTFALHNIWVHNCIGLSAKDIAFYGLRSNAKNERRAAQPKRLETLFMQSANLICLIAQEVSGATSLNDISTIAAGYLWYLENNNIEKYTDYQLENIWQEFLYNVNLPFRSGNSPFSNITLDFGKPNTRLKDEAIVYAGNLLDKTYGEIPSEYFDRINFAFINAMSKGDAEGNPFTFPLITVNITENFDRKNPAWKELLRKSEYFGGFYVQNYLKKPFEKDSIYKKKNPYIKAFDEGMIYSNCCRVMFDMSQVEAVTGSNPFHSGAGVGGIGVYAINMNRILFLAKNDFNLLKKMLDYELELGRQFLQRKRDWLNEHWTDLYPYLSFYQKSTKSLFNIFSPVGVHEGMINAGYEGGLFNDEAKEYAHKIAQYFYKKIHEFIEKDKVLYSIEYAPSENAACKMAEKDVEFAYALADAMNGKRDFNLSRNSKLNEFIKEAVDKFGEDIFNLVKSK